MGKRGLITIVFLASLGGGMIAIGGYQFLMGDNPQSVEYQSIAEHQKVSLARLDEATTFNYNSNVPAELNFVASAAIATKAVVHISSKYEGATSYNGFFRYRSYPIKFPSTGEYDSINSPLPSIHFEPVETPVFVVSIPSSINNSSILGASTIVVEIFFCAKLTMPMDRTIGIADNKKAPSSNEAIILKRV